MIEAPSPRAKSYRRETCQSVSGTRRALSVMRAAMSSGTWVPSCGRLTSSGASRWCRWKMSSMRAIVVGGLRAQASGQHQFLGGSRMDGHGVVQLGTGDAELQGHREALQDLVHRFAQQVDA